jgi:hypothetical protein
MVWVSGSDLLYDVLDKLNDGAVPSGLVKAITGLDDVLSKNGSY